MVAEHERKIVCFRDWHAANLRAAQKRDILLWGNSFLSVLALSGGTLWFIICLHPVVAALPEPVPAAIAIDMAPEPVSALMPPTDVAPGPQQTLSQSDPVPDPPPKITAPLSPAPNPPVPVPQAEKQKILKKKSRPSVQLQKRVSPQTPAAEATTAPPSAEALPAPVQAAPTPGSSSSPTSSDQVSWQGTLLARLEKYKRYPEEAQSARQEGTAFLHFSMNRKGHVISASIETSSGHSLLDQETMMLVHRAEPLPAPPDSIAGDPITLTVPVEFYLNQNPR
ncbi:energy transducer TonB family protein [Acetobacter oeni]|uniref:energy transducer TonB family protein n=1 Tax=Acetobacter oeni TaxID=304077 RepID=UPI0011BED871|nr:energy transducer TonB [Acetobacter oeni]NHO19440.1 TonB family protein [Acetobacter oeni]